MKQSCSGAKNPEQSDRIEERSVRNGVDQRNVIKREKNPDSLSELKHFKHARWLQSSQKCVIKDLIVRRIGIKSANKKNVDIASSSSLPHCPRHHRRLQLQSPTSSAVRQPFRMAGLRCVQPWRFTQPRRGIVRGSERRPGKLVAEWRVSSR